MIKEELDLLDRHTALMLNSDFSGMVPAGRKLAIQKALRGVRDQYELAATARDAKETTEKERQYYVDVCESIAKGLPNLSKGVLSAVSAFKGGDDIGGAAAIMDICATLAPILGSLSAAGGPPGMLIGALFSIVSQLLAFFGPKQPSLTDQIKGIIDRAASEEKLATMRAVADSIEIYDATIRAQCAKMGALLSSSLDPQKIDESIWSDIGALRHGLNDDQRSLDVSNFATWQALEWLGLEGKSELDYWPEILGVCAQACTKLVAANTALACAIDRAQLELVLKFHQENNAQNSASPAMKQKMREAWLKMDAAIREIYSQWLPRYSTLARILEKLTPLARDRGLFCHLGSGNLYACTGPKAIASGDWTYLTNRYLSSLAVALTQADVGKPNPRYHCVLQQPAYSIYGHRTWHYMLSAGSPPSVDSEQSLATWYNSSDGPHHGAGIADLCAVAGGGPEHSKEIYIYVAGDKRISALEYNEQHKLENRGWRSPEAKAEVVLVRAVHPKVVSGDKAAELLGPERMGGQILYGALQGSADIFLCTGGNPSHGYVTAPWTSYK
ncbi:MAG: hypothetical protein JWN04_5421, partial [Myxococcaceae bacterium]|nr:hypothetical protein [Myxococcaceae bacterium]